MCPTANVGHFSRDNIEDARKISTIFVNQQLLRYRVISERYPSKLMWCST